MREIWDLQQHLPRRRGRKVFQTLEHPRFRAAYDFLLRASRPANSRRSWASGDRVPARRREPPARADEAGRWWPTRPPPTASPSAAVRASAAAQQPRCTADPG
ncbi:hypothetical protein [Salinicola tamaricis]|uniref:hypothetical protein n=1 Tax=Salinicola tamaricis TaxID=1771309 RepID=UPI003BF5C54A